MTQVTRNSLSLDEPISAEDVHNSVVTSVPRIEIKTLVQDLTRSPLFSDKELADAQNDRWEVLDIAVTTHVDIGADYAALFVHTRIVTLVRETAADNPLKAFEEAIAHLKTMPNVAGVIIEDVPVPSVSIPVNVAPLVTAAPPLPARERLQPDAFALLTSPGSPHSTLNERNT